MTTTSADRGGFTLIEALIAMLLATLIVALVGSIFLAQNNFYADVVRRSEAQDDVRSVVELVSADVQSASPDGIGVADHCSVSAAEPMRASWMRSIRRSWRRPCRRWTTAWRRATAIRAGRMRRC